MPPPLAAPRATRWTILLALLGAGWLLTPHPVPLYDGIGFPDQPYRFVPAKAGAAAATAASVRLPVARGVNTGGLIGNSAEVGPQVSVYAPPRAFAVSGTAPVVVAATPVLPVEPLPPGRRDSNVYALTFTSTAGPVSLVREAQSPALTMRAASPDPDAVFEYRPAPSAGWRELTTRRVGHDIFTTSAPGAGEYALVRLTGAGTDSGPSRRGPLALVLGAALALVVLVLVGVRLLARRAPQP